MKAMKSSGNHPITGTTKVDEAVFGGAEEGVRGRKNRDKKLVGDRKEKEEREQGVRKGNPQYKFRIPWGLY